MIIRSKFKVKYKEFEDKGTIDRCLCIDHYEEAVAKLVGTDLYYTADIYWHTPSESQVNRHPDRIVCEKCLKEGKHDSNTQASM